MVDAGHDVLRAEGDLLGLGEEIVDIGIERQRADDLDRDLFLGDDLGRVEHVEFELFGEFLVEHLDAEVPLRIVARVDRVPHVAAMEVGVHPVDLERLVPDRLQPSEGFQWNLTKCALPSALTSRKVCTPKPSMKRKPRGIVRSDMIHMTMFIASGLS